MKQSGQQRLQSPSQSNFTRPAQCQHHSQHTAGRHHHHNHHPHLLLRGGHTHETAPRLRTESRGRGICCLKKQRSLAPATRHQIRQPPERLNTGHVPAAAAAHSQPHTANQTQPTKHRQPNTDRNARSFQHLIMTPITTLFSGTAGVPTNHYPHPHPHHHTHHVRRPTPPETAPNGDHREGSANACADTVNPGNFRRA